MTSSYLSVQWHLCSDSSGCIDGKQLLVVHEPIMDLTAGPQIWICSLNMDVHKVQMVGLVQSITLKSMK